MRTCIHLIRLLYIGVSIRGQFCLLMLCMCSFLLPAQETVVVGQVVDRFTGDPIPNANIYFKQSKIGTATNDEGWFMLRTQEQHKSRLMISAIGYKPMHFKIEQGSYRGLHVELQENPALLPEVTVVPGTNPAWEILAHVRTYAHANDVNRNSDLCYQQEETTTLYAARINSRMLQRSVWRNLRKGLITAEDSTLLLPLYMSRKQLTRQGESRKDSLLDDTARPENRGQIQALLTLPDRPMNFYRNHVPLFSKNFISPLAGAGKSYYNYTLTDSIIGERGKQYRIRFTPSSNAYLAFRGEMVIDSGSYALQSIRAELPEHLNLNYIKRLSVSQSFSTHPGAPFVPTEARYSALMDYAFMPDTTRQIFPALLWERTVRTTDVAQIFSDTILPSDCATHLAYETTVRTAIDSIRQTPLIRFAEWIITPFITGYLPLGYVDLGDIEYLISFGSAEKFRLGIPFRTSERLCKYVSIGGYAGYGFGDRTWKWGAYLQGRLPGRQRHSLRVGVIDDYMRSEMNHFDLFKHENTSGTAYQDFFTGLMPNTLKQSNFDRTREVSAVLRNDWTDDFETCLAYYGGHRHYGDPYAGYYNMPSYLYHSAVLSGRISFNERMYDAYFQRIYIYNYLPVIMVAGEAGCYRMPGTTSNKGYGKVHLALRQRVPLGAAGELRYLLEGGVVLGNVPYPLLEIMHGNQTWGYDDYKFSLMNDLEFAADRYATLHASWNMGGLLFNRIPWINRLDLRERVTLRAAWGGLSGGHATVLSLPEGMSEPIVPYLETGVGICNIFTLLNVDFLWRLTHREHTAAPLWGVRFQLNLGI